MLLIRPSTTSEKYVPEATEKESTYNLNPEELYTFPTLISDFFESGEAEQMEIQEKNKEVILVYSP